MDERGCAHVPWKTLFFIIWNWSVHIFRPMIWFSERKDTCFWCIVSDLFLPNLWPKSSCSFSSLNLSYIHLVYIHKSFNKCQQVSKKVAEEAASLNASSLDIGCQVVVNLGISKIVLSLCPDPPFPRSHHFATVIHGSMSVLHGCLASVMTMHPKRRHDVESVRDDLAYFQPLDPPLHF